MLFQEILAIVLYFAGLFTIGFLSYRKQHTDTDFIMGGRSLGYWLTALAAHASDMSSWLFIAYPASLFIGGMKEAWTGIGLFVCMFLNWQFIAPKIRTATEQFNSLTFSSFFENRLGDRSGMIRVFTALILFVFYTIYISAGLVGLGLLLETLFQIPYSIGVIVGIVIVIPYVFMGGYATLAWIDLFQGLFLMCVIIFVPLYMLPNVGGWDGIRTAAAAKNLSFALFPSFNFHAVTEVLLMSFGWGLGYFGQPHIVTKFMGIRNVHDIAKSKYIGMSWMFLSLSAATLVGLVGIAYFKSSQDPQLMFIDMVKNSFPPFVIGLILCAVLAATINAMSSQVLVLSSSFTEDFYKRLFRKQATPKELLLVSRLGVILVSLIAFAIAYGKVSTIYSLVLYAWSGIGSSFGPLIVLSLYSKNVNKYGAWAGIVSGGLIAGLWPYLNRFFPLQMPAMVPGFIVGILSIIIVSRLTNGAEADVESP